MDSAQIWWVGRGKGEERGEGDNIRI